jgi:hypothetical protein
MDHSMAEAAEAVATTAVVAVAQTQTRAAPMQAVVEVVLHTPTQH